MSNYGLNLSGYGCIMSKYGFSDMCCENMTREHCQFPFGIP